MKVDDDGRRKLRANSTTRTGSLINHLKPLYLVSKVLSLSPFRLIYGRNKGARPSIPGTVQSLAALVLYGSFHLYSNWSDDFNGGGTADQVQQVVLAHPGHNGTDRRSNGTDGQVAGGNFVSVMIDVYSRYSGLVLYWVLVAGAIGNQRILMSCLETFVEVDEIFEGRLGMEVPNVRWKRLIYIQTALIGGLIAIFEWFNCLMYLSDYEPASEFCLPQCYLTLATSIVGESQFVGYVKLLELRFQLINRLLGRLNELDEGGGGGVSSDGGSMELTAETTRSSSSSNRTQEKSRESTSPIPSSLIPSSSSSKVNELWWHDGEISENQRRRRRQRDHIFQPLSHPTANANNGFVKEMTFKKKTLATAPKSTLEIGHDENYPNRQGGGGMGGVGVGDGNETIKRRLRGKRLFAIQRLLRRGRNQRSPPIACKSQTTTTVSVTVATVTAMTNDAGRHRLSNHHRVTNVPLRWPTPTAITGIIKQESAADLQPDYARQEIIQNIKNLYSHLHLLSLNINKAYGVQLIFTLATLFIAVTTLLYHCTMKAIRLLLHHPSTSGNSMRNAWELLSGLAWAAVCAYRMFRICNSCNSTKNEAHQIGCLIHGLGMHAKSGSTKAMVKLLSLQLLQQRVDFTACGLFSIDHGLMFNIVGSVTTYILILLQFDIAQNKSDWQMEPH